MDKKDIRRANLQILQQALIDLQYLTGKADGVYGNKTEAAVKEFQRKNGGSKIFSLPFKFKSCSCFCN